MIWPNPDQKDKKGPSDVENVNDYPVILLFPSIHRVPFMSWLPSFPDPTYPPPTTSYKLQIQITNTNYKYELQIQITQIQQAASPLL